MQSWTADDFESIRVLAEQYAGWKRGWCKIRHGPIEERFVQGCWCYMRGKNLAAHLRCPPSILDSPEQSAPPKFHLPEMPVPWFPKP